MAKKEITVTITVPVSYYEDKSNLNSTEFFNKIYNSFNVLEARNELAQEVKIAAIKLLAGEDINE
jgi:hypothetical protein